MLNKKEFRDLVLESAYELTGIHFLKKDGEMMIDAVGMALEKAFVSGKGVEFRGVGRFYIHPRKARTLHGVDGNDYEITARNSVSFRSSAGLKKEMAQGFIQ